MANVEQRIKARLGAARMILVEHKGKPTYESISHLQAAAAVEILKVGNSELSANCRADIAEKIVRVPWAGTDAALVLSALQPSQQIVPSRRRLQQDYLAISSYGTPAYWTLLTGPDASSDHKLFLIIDRATTLGMRNPSEHTMKHIAALWAISSCQRMRSRP